MKVDRVSTKPLFDYLGITGIHDKGVPHGFLVFESECMNTGSVLHRYLKEKHTALYERKGDSDIAILIARSEDWHSPENGNRLDNTTKRLLLAIENASDDDEIIV